MCVCVSMVRIKTDLISLISTRVHASKTHKLPGLLPVFTKEAQNIRYTMILDVKQPCKLTVIAKKDELLSVHFYGKLDPTGGT